MFTPPALNPGTPYFLRLFGGRDTYLGVAAMIAKEPTRSQLLGAAAAVDALDACSALAAGLKGNLPRRAAFFAAAAGIVGSALGLAAAGRGPLARH